jgi:beta-N-acetylhexosaminidase
VQDRISKIVTSMTTEQKLAQMMIVSLRSDPDNTNLPQEVSQDYADLVSKYDFGGVILFAGNMTTPEQTVAFTRALQTAAINSKQGIPLFIAADEEGGMVTRVPFGVVGPGNMALAATGNPELIAESASMLGRSLATLGINANFAPDADVNNNPNNPVIGVRAFSDDPEIVAQDVALFVKAMKDTGVIPTIKHFPGHGNVGEDSHHILPASDLSLDQIMTCELVPFKAGIDAGADMIMTAHIQYHNIEKETYKSKKDGSEISLPATLSHTFLTDILRDQLGFKGIVTTDSMVMEAIAEHFDRIDAAVLAINAGVDILLGPVDLYKDNSINTFPEMDVYLSELVKRVENGDITQERLDESVTRILTLKAEQGILDDTLTKSSEEQVAEAQALASDTEAIERDWELAQLAVTLLKNDEGLLPLDGTDGARTLILFPSMTRKPTVEYAIKQLQDEHLLAEDTTSILCYAEMAADDQALQEQIDQADRLLVLTQAPSRNEALASAIDKAHAANKKVALISLNLPYEAACYSDADAALCGYQPYGAAFDTQGNGPVNMNVATVLFTAFGKSVPQGTLPVNVPTYSDADKTFSSTEVLYERGFGMQNWGK